jgi:cyclic pyranopterin phosphate synthase
VGFKGLKIDTVVTHGVNDDELVDILEYGKEIGAEVRFIEYMDVGGATQWSMSKVVSRLEILDILGREYGQVKPIVEKNSAPAQRYVLPDGTIFGIIASVTTPFCSNCDRSRITVDGMWYLCLYTRNGIDLKQSLRDGASNEEIMAIIVDGWMKRMNRGAEERKELRFRGVLAQVEELRKDTHLEMHTRGG